VDVRSLDRALAILATLCALVVALMVASIVWTKSSQDFFQIARALPDYAAHLAETPLNAPGLRINLGLDNLFMIFYAAFFVLLATRLRELVDGRILTVALAAMLLTALLDALENHHIMTMVHSIENALPLAVGDGQFQMVASQIKFHASYLSVLLFSLGLWKLGSLGRLIAVSLWCYIPCGVLLSVLPADSAKALVLARTVFFIFAFVLSAILFFGSTKPAEQPAP
jgi:hypothetical protein